MPVPTARSGCFLPDSKGRSLVERSFFFWGVSAISKRAALVRGTFSLFGCGAAGQTLWQLDEQRIRERAHVFLQPREAVGALQ